MSRRNDANLGASASALARLFAPPAEISAVQKAIRHERKSRPKPRPVYDDPLDRLAALWKRRKRRMK